VREHRIDVAFVTGEPMVAGCDVARLWTERVFTVLPETHALAGEHGITWEALRDEHFIVRSSEAGPEVHDYVIQRLAELGHHPSVERYRVGRETLMHLVALGFGISLTSEATIATRFPEVVFRPLATSEDVLPFSAVWAPTNDNPVLRRFLSLARRLSAEQQTERGRRAALRVVP
jgi:DNA-binding transcriptional LysR family regulator